MFKKISVFASIIFGCLACQTHSDSDTEKFILLNQSLEHAVIGAQYASERMLDELKKRVEDEGNSPEGLNCIKRAKDLKSKTFELFKTIEKLKKELMDNPNAGNGINLNTGVINNPKNVSSVKKLMIGAGKEGKGYALKKVLDTYVNYLNTQFVADKTLGFNGRFETLAKDNHEIKLYEDNTSEKGKDFATANFGQASIVAAIAILMQRQAEIIRYEQEVLKKFGSADGNYSYSRIRFDKVTPFISADAYTVEAGQPYKAQLFIMSTPSKSGARMTFNGQPIRVNADGIGEVGFIATGKGKQTWTGTVTIRQKGKDTTFVLKKEYEVIDSLKR